MRQFPRLPLRRRRCSLYARLFDSHAPTTFYPLTYHLRPPPPSPPPPPPVSTHHAPSNLLLPSSSTSPSSPHFLVLSSLDASSFSSAFLPRPNHESLHRTIAAESFRLEISTMRLSTVLPAAIPIACILLSASTVALYHPRSSDSSHPGWRSNR